jgi:hypothetical protein
MSDRGDESRDHVLRPELFAPDPLPMTGTDRDQQDESLARQMIAGNAISRYREDGERGWVSYSRRKNWYADRNRRFYSERYFSYRFILAAMAQMDSAELIEHDKKLPGNRHWQSRFRATEKLVSGNPKVSYAPKRRIILRDGEGDDIAYNDKAQRIVGMLRDIDQINAYLAKQTVSLGGKVLREGDPLYTGTHCVTGTLRISTRRIFHDGSFHKGGRFYNDLQNIPKEARRWLNLAGYPIEIYDYSAFYPRLLYAMAGEPLSRDPYVIPHWAREISKPALNILINAKTGLAAVRAVAQDLKPRIGGGQGKRMEQARQIIAALKEANQPIAEAFHSGAGLHLMWQEAFLLQQNMRALMTLRIPFLPLHDALIVPEPAYPELKSIMQRNLQVLEDTLIAGSIERQKWVSK